ncbi:MAG: thioredoxin-disulfide reductase [Elusimicrobia bacterium]|nr:thioredoxin-disulfide reductase [Elusimicrobiota bacterium]
MYDTIIIGGGPAGLTAGIYASRARLKTLLIDNYNINCQMITTDLIENFPGFPEGVRGTELLSKLKTQAEKFGLKTVSAEVISAECTPKQIKIKTDSETYTPLSLIVATGAVPRALDVPGEAELKGKGVSYCATCDAAFFRDKTVIAVGGGNTAIEEALFLTKFAKKIFVVHRRDKLRATKILQERAFKNSKIEFLWNSKVIGIGGTNKVENVTVETVRSPSPPKREKVNCDGIFVFVGYTPNTSFLKNIVKLDESGYIITDNEMKTGKDNIFACGDCRAKMLRQIITACGEGASAAFSAEKYLEKIKKTECETC